MNTGAANGNARGLGFSIAGQPITVIDVIYLALLIFFFYQLYKSNKLMKLIEEPKYVYKTKFRMMNLVLTAFITVFGVLNVVWQDAYVTGFAMIILSIVFFISTQSKVVVAKNGIFADNRFLTWNEIRKWAWDSKGGNLVIISKEYGKPESREILRVGQVNMAEINERIRFFKLGKSSDLLEEEMPIEQVDSSDDRLEEDQNLEETERKEGLAGTGKSRNKKRKKRK